MKWLVLIYFLFDTTFCAAQAAYMHEVYEDSLDTEPITISSLLTGLVFILIIYVVYNIFASLHEETKKKRQRRIVERKKNEKKMDDISNSLYEIISKKNKEFNGSE